jgi:hypothetical protein
MLDYEFSSGNLSDGPLLASAANHVLLKPLRARARKENYFYEEKRIAVLKARRKPREHKTLLGMITAWFE